MLKNQEVDKYFPNEKFLAMRCISTEQPDETRKSIRFEIQETFQ